MLTYILIIAVFFALLIIATAFILIIRTYRSASRSPPDWSVPKWGLFSRVNEDDSNGLCWDGFDIYQGSEVIPSKIFMSRCVGIQPRKFEDLQKSEEQLAEIASNDAEEEVPKPPKVKFTLKFNTIRSTLVVHVLGAQNVPKRVKGEVAYYVTLKIFPQPHRTFHTRAIESGNPLQFNELFEFEILASNLLDQSLKLILSYFDRFSHHDVIGDLIVELDELESRGLTLSREILLCKELYSVAAGHPFNGEIMLSLGYLRLTERLAVVVILAKNLRLLETNIKPDPYVEVTLFHGHKAIKTKNTSSKLKDCNPVFNESLTFYVPHGILHQSSLLISVKNDAGLNSNDIILGQVLLGPEASRIQFEHWNEMRVNNKPIARWHNLQEG